MSGVWGIKLNVRKMPRAFDHLLLTLPCSHKGWIYSGDTLNPFLKAQ